MNDGIKLFLCGAVLVAGLVTWSVIDRMDRQVWPLLAEENPVKLGLVDEVVQKIDIRLKNHGTVPIRIVAVKKGCTCQGIELPEPIVMPGEMVPLHVNLDCRGRAGPFRTAIEVDYRLEVGGGDSNQSHGTVLTEPVVLEAMVKASPFEPGRDLEFTVPPGASGQIVQSFRFMKSTGAPRRILSAESWDTRIRAEINENSGLTLYVDVEEISRIAEVTVEIKFDEPDSRLMRSVVRFRLPGNSGDPESVSVSSFD